MNHSLERNWKNCGQLPISIIYFRHFTKSQGKKVKPVAVVILNWNGKEFLQKFLPSVIQFSADIADVYVIDNYSSDDSVRFLKENYPRIKVVELDDNYGFAGGYNLGLSSISNDYYILLNSDVEVTENWIQPMLEYINSQPGMVACQPKILDYHRKEWFEYAGAAGGYIDKDAFAFCAGRIFYKFEKDHSQYQENEEVFWASGASLLIKRKAWEEVDGLDPDFFAHMEEIDLCWRLKNRGYKIGACRNSVVYHYGGGTLDRQSPFKTYLNFRNNLYLIIKNDHSGSLFLKTLRRLFLDSFAGMRFLTEGKFSHLISIVKAHFSFYGNLGVYLKKRKEEKLVATRPNRSGVYQGSIIKHFFVFKKHYFAELNKDLFLRK